MDKVKKLARRVSSLHRHRPPGIEKENAPPVPQKPTARDSFPKTIVEIANAQRVREWDHGVFQQTLMQHDIYPRDLSNNPDVSNDPKISEGSFHGTKNAITQAYNSIENRYATYYDAVNFEPSLPQDRDLEECRQLYQYQLPGKDSPYPPCLSIIPEKVRVGQIFGPNHLFDHMRLFDTASILLRIIPDRILNWLHDHPESDTLDGIRNREQALRRKGADIYTDADIGDRLDWYTDAVFAQQQFTGPNPTTITQASAEWLSRFEIASRTQRNTDILNIIMRSDTLSFYIQDCSYFREAIKANKTANIQTEDRDGKRFLCATVTLFQLNAEGKLHPLGIIVDYKDSIDNSVTIFNDRLDPSASSNNEATNWPWRYAKMCAQVADWTRHEITIHLTNAHFIEEAVIVACNRTLPSTHAVYKLLQPHWLKTLSLNRAARTTLVPAVIVPIAGMTETDIHAFIRYAYSNFDWPSLNVPNDLNRRGFPIFDLDTSAKYHNYAYGRNILLMWQVLRKFVLSVLQLAYPNDDSVLKDQYIQALSTEVRSATGGQLSTFPKLDTLSALADAVTMIIHIASPQHTAVNYTQDYYQSFLPNKPSALCTAPPLSLVDLMAFKEKDIIDALPVKRPRQWLLATHLPHLLSYRVAEEQNLVTFALSLSKNANRAGNYELAKAAAHLWQDLVDCGQIFDRNSQEMDDQTKPYDVLSPKDTAVSILI